MFSRLSGRTYDNIKYKNLYQIFEEHYSNVNINEKILHEVGAGRFTYGQLYERILRTSFWISEVNLRKGSVVGVFLPNGINRIAMILALAKHGIIFFPIDPVLTKENLEQNIQHVQVDLVVIENHETYIKT